jgi:hypothetical protein
MVATTALIIVPPAPGLAQAATQSPGSIPKQAPKLPYKLGTYAGRIDQKAPRSSRDRIGFVVHRQRITALTFTVGVMCHSLRVTDRDVLTGFRARVTRAGAFSYSGTMHGRHIRLRGRLKAGRATGTFFQSFASGRLNCSMNKPASFTATR